MRLFAHRGMPGPLQNTLTGVRHALSKGYAGVEIDLVLTRDGVAVLSHDPWLHPEHVVDVHGATLDERVLIRELDLAQIRQGFRVGAPGPPEEIGTLDDVLRAMSAYPEVELYLDLKIEPPRLELTASARAMAQALDRSLQRTPLARPVLVECGSTHIRRVIGQQLQHPFTAMVSFPRFVVDTDDTWEALRAGVKDLLGVEEPHDVACKVGAPHFAAAAPLITRASVEEARWAGVGAFLFGVDDAGGLERIADWPLQGVIVDHFTGALQS